MTSILYILEHVGLGGGETSFVYFLKALNRARYRPVVMLPSPGPLSERVQGLGGTIELLAFPRRPLPIGWLQAPWLIGRLYRLCKRYGITCIHTHSFNALWYLAPVSFLARIPIVWTCHGWWPARRLTGWLINRAVKRVIAVSQYVMDKLIQEGHVESDRIRVIHLGVDVEGFSSQGRTDLGRAFGFPDGTFVVGMIARYQWIKGHDRFVRAAAVVCQHLDHCKFVMAGANVFGSPEDERYRATVEQLIRQLGLQDGIVVTGFRTDMAELLGSLDVLVVPSHMETFSMVVVEAMARGTPVVASAVGGIRDLIEHEKEGLLVQASEPEAIAEAILRVARDPDGARRRANAARMKASEQFDVMRHANRIEALYEQLLARRQ